VVVEIGSLIEFWKRETAVSALEKSVKHAQIVQECVKKLDDG
jgi:D-tyrosyl-tRNA(Tyr) deacylase